MCDAPHCILDRKESPSDLVSSSVSIHKAMDCVVVKTRWEEEKENEMQSDT